MNSKRIKDLELKILDLKRQLPAHSIPPTMILELEELEDDLVAERKKLNKKGEDIA